MALIVVNFAALLRDMGTSAAVIQRESINDRLLDTVFWFTLAVGAGLATVVSASAVPFSAVFRQPGLSGVIVALSVSFPVACCGAVHQSLLERSLEFRKLAWIECSSGVLGLTVAVVAALHGAGVYSLVLNSVITATATSVQLWATSSWRPTARWSATDFRGLWGFSSHLVGFQIVNYCSRNIDSMLIGRFLGAQQLGWYNMGYRLMLFPLQNLSSVVARALYPVLSRRQHDLESLRTLYLRIVAGVALITAPLMVGLWVLRVDAITVILGERWVAVINVLTWLAPVGLIQSLLSTVGLLYMTTGSTRAMMQWGAVASAVYVAGIAIGLRWGYVGAAAGYAVANLMLVIPGFAVPFRIVGLRLIQLVTAIWRQGLASLIMGVTVWGLLATVLRNSESTTRLCTLIPIGLAAYAAAGWLLMRPLIVQVVPGLGPLLSAGKVGK